MKKQKPISRSVFTFHENIPGQSPENAIKLLLLWKQCWSKHGFMPIVLNESHAQKHELWGFFNRRIEVLPTINKASYERSCYLRWMAMAAAGGGIMVDYDVMIYSIPEELRARLQEPITILQSHIPSVCVGSKKAYEDVVKQMLDYKVTEKDLEENSGLPHVSDMYMFYRNGIRFEKKEIVKNFGDEGWEAASLVHYANSTMKNAQEPRHSLIPKVRAI